MAMTQPNLFVKVAVVTSSVLLVGACVGYRAGAFDWLVADKRGNLGESETRPPIEPAARDTPAGESPANLDLPPAVMSGSKSAILIVPPSTSSGPQSPPTQPPPTIMYSSKSMAPLIKLPDTQSSQPAATPPAAAAEPKPKKPVIFPGSKSDRVFIPPPEKPVAVPPAPPAPPK
jgi:hypothetical protein